MSSSINIDKSEVDTLIFGECQSLLFNYETYIIRFFGDSYSINESLVYSLQFSQMRTKEQVSASKSALSKDLRDIVKYIDGYRHKGGFRYFSRNGIGYPVDGCFRGYGGIVDGYYQRNEGASGRLVL